MAANKERVLGLGGVAVLVFSVGWMDLAGCFGFQVWPATKEVVVANSQCADAERQIDPETERLTCLKDAAWLKRYFKDCAARTESQLASIEGGKLLYVRTCSKAASEAARIFPIESISQDQNVDEIIKSTGK